MSPRHNEERELQELLRNAAAVILLALFSMIVVLSLVTPFLSERSADTTLLLGLASSALGATLALLGVQIAIRRGGHDIGPNLEEEDPLDEYLDKPLPEEADDG